MRVQASDIRASIVVFLVALPLCLGIALASNAPLSSGILAGIIGGMVIGILGGSDVSVSGPAAGLTVIVASAIAQLGGFPAFTAAVVLAGLIQLALGFLKAGELGNFFPASVIKGMLAAIGLILILKQIPHAVGWDHDYMGDESFDVVGGENTFSELLNGWNRLHWGATTVALVALVIMLVWDKILIKKFPKLSLIPSALLAVIVSVILNELVLSQSAEFAIEATHLVQLPFTGGLQSFFDGINVPDLRLLQEVAVWKFAFTIAIVASLETLLSLDAAEKIDPLKRVSRKNKELRAQGLGNLLSGLVGGLPMTAVIVRTSANVTGGGLHRTSSFFHGVWLLLAMILFPTLLNRIPLAALAAVLLLVGYKLCSPGLVKQQWKQGVAQFVPFVITVIAIMFTDLLVGITVGLFVGLIFVLRSNSHSSILKIELDGQVLIRFCKDVSFLQKNRLRAILRDMPDESRVVIDGSRSVQVDHDIVELVEDFMLSAPSRNINVKLQKSPLALCEMFKGNP